MAKVLIGNFKGPKGDKGDKGDPGTAASIQVGTVQTVQPEENAEVTNSGTTTAAVLNFKIPRGKDGMTDLTAEYSDASEYTCQPTVNAPVVVKGVDGKTEQAETTGKNLFNINGNVNTQGNDYQQLNVNTVSGNVLTCNVNGQKTNAVGQTISGLNSKTVTFSAKVISFGSGIEASIFVYENGGYNNNLVYAEEVNSVIKITCAISTDNPVFAFATINGTGAQFTDIQVEIGETNTDWEPYTGGQPAPSPDYPQVIKGVGGMGYFDGEWRQGSYSISGVPDNSGAWISFANKILCKANDNIKVSYDKDIVGIRIFFWNTSGGFLSTEPIDGKETTGWTAPSTAGSFVISFNDDNISPALAAYCTVTINGEYATGLETQGRNLANVPRDNLNLTAQLTVPKFRWTGGNTVYFKFIANTDNINGEVIFEINYYDKDNDLLGGNGVAKKVGQNTYDYIDFFEGYGANEENNVDLSNVSYMVAKINVYNASAANFSVKDLIISDFDLTNTDYIPYHHTAISITLTTPLYEGDKICYVKPGESYVDSDGDTVVADRILYGVYRENGRVVFDGSEDEAWKFENINNNRTNIALENCYNLYTVQSAKCNLFKYNVNVYTDAGNEIGFIVYLNLLYIRFGSDSEVNSLEALKTWLQSNPLTVVYKLATPYFEPFVDQSIFYTLRTDDTLSYIYSSDPIEPVLTVEVAKNSTGGYLLESYAQAQKNAISEANSQSRLSAIEQQLVNQATTPTE